MASLIKWVFYSPARINKSFKWLLSSTKYILSKGFKLKILLSLLAILYRLALLNIL